MLIFKGIKMDVDLAARIERYADEHDVSFSEAVRQLAGDQLDRLDAQEQGLVAAR